MIINRSKVVCQTCEKEKEIKLMKQCPKCREWHCKIHYGEDVECHVCVFSNLADAIMNIKSFRKED